jgi:hypothetical protein
MSSADSLGKILSSHMLGRSCMGAFTNQFIWVWGGDREVANILDKYKNVYVCMGAWTYTHPYIYIYIYIYIYMHAYIHTCMHGMCTLFARKNIA